MDEETKAAAALLSQDLKQVKALDGFTQEEKDKIGALSTAIAEGMRTANPKGTLNRKLEMTFAALDTVKQMLMPAYKAINDNSKDQKSA